MDALRGAYDSDSDESTSSLNDSNVQNEDQIFEEKDSENDSQIVTEDDTNPDAASEYSSQLRRLSR